MMIPILLIACGALVPTEVEPTHYHTFGGYGNGPSNFMIPVGGVFYNNELYVVNSTPARVQVYTPEGTFVRQFGVYGTAPGQLNTPYYMAVYGGELYITEVGNNRVSVMSTQGVFSRTFGAGQLSSPNGIYISSDKIYVANKGADNIKVFNHSGALIATWGMTGTANGQFRDPIGITGTSTKIYIADRQNNRIQVFTPAGVYLTQTFVDYPIACRVIGGTLYTTQREGVRRYTLDLVLLAAWGCNGNLRQWYMNSPQDLDGDLNCLWVVDTNNHRVQRWQYVAVCVPGP